MVPFTQIVFSTLVTIQPLGQFSTLGNQVSTLGLENNFGLRGEGYKCNRTPLESLSILILVFWKTPNPNPNPNSNPNPNPNPNPKWKK